MSEPLIERTEVVALLFNVSDIVSALERIERLPGEDDDEEEATEAERAVWEAQRAQMRANAQRTRELAERAQAKLDAKARQQ